MGETYTRIEDRLTGGGQNSGETKCENSIDFRRLFIDVVCDSLEWIGLRGKNSKRVEKLTKSGGSVRTISFEDVAINGVRA